jgi:hypothetical protein
MIRENNTPAQGSLSTVVVSSTTFSVDTVRLLNSLSLRERARVRGFNEGTLFFFPSS